MLPICIIDESVLIYKLLEYPIPINTGEGYVYETRHVAEYSKEYNTALKHLAPTNQHLLYYAAYSIINPAHNVTLSPKNIILAEDRKRRNGTYWRHDVLPTYKNGRSPTKPLGFYLIRDAYRNLAKMFPFIEVVGKVGYEADDIAGYYRRFYDCPLVFETTDSDWYQLMLHKDDILIDPLRYPQVMNPEQVLQKYQKRYPNDCVLSIHEIAEHKAIKGDASDNIPPGSPIGLTDLLNPIKSPDQLTELSLEEPTNYSKLVRMSQRLTEQGVYLWG